MFIDDRNCDIFMVFSYDDAKNLSLFSNAFKNALQEVERAFLPYDALLHSTPHVRFMEASVTRQELQLLRERYHNRLVCVTIVSDDPALHGAQDFLNADLMLSSDHLEKSMRHIQRFIRLIYNYPFVTPDGGETAMMHAFVARLQSGDPSRQVGACLINDQHHILGTGCNEIPKAGGGIYSNADSQDQDYRDWPRNKNPSIDAKREIFTQILSYLQNVRHVPIPKDFFEEAPLKELLLELKQHTSFMQILEYSRNIHAEMNALLSALNTGASVQGATLYTTTFPCHQCAKHLVGAGIKRVIYWDPFAKSRALELFEDSIVASQMDQGQDNRVQFDHFTGITPRRYHLFEAPQREDPYGAHLPWEKKIRAS